MKLNILLLFRQWSFYFIVGMFLVCLIAGITTELSLIIAFIYLFLIVLVYSVSILYMGLSSKNRNFFLPAQYVFNDEGVSIKTTISDETSKWDIFIEWKKISGYYLIYVSSRNFLCIPKLVIPDQEIPAFESLLNGKINKRGVKR